MFHSSQYELVDFGNGRKLERFGPHLLDRPAPAAQGNARRLPNLWRSDARFDRREADRGEWKGTLPSCWSVSHPPAVFEVRPTPFGHLGVFPEQAANWDWLAELIRAAKQQPRVLNLFAYTGGSTLAATAAGAQVTHVDSAGSTVAWARRNAELSGMGKLPIRWIQEDAMKFARRELKRGARYDAVILDPPSYGHGKRGETWKLDEHLEQLLTLCRDLTAGRNGFVLLTCHSSGIGPDALRRLWANAYGRRPEHIECAEMFLQTAAGDRLPSGAVLRSRFEL